MFCNSIRESAFIHICSFYITVGDLSEPCAVEFVHYVRKCATEIFFGKQFVSLKVPKSFSSLLEVNVLVLAWRHFFHVHSTTDKITIVSVFSNLNLITRTSTCARDTYIWDRRRVAYSRKVRRVTKSYDCLEMKIHLHIYGINVSNRFIICIQVKFIGVNGQLKVGEPECHDWEISSVS